MAYNLQSLITILEQVLNPQQTRWILDFNQPQIESLLEKAVSLRQILENSSGLKIETSLEDQIRDAAYKAEDIIESRMVDHMLSNPEGMIFTFFTPDLQQVLQELDSLMEQVVKLMEGNRMSSGSSRTGAPSSLMDPSSKSIVVGVDEDLLQLKDRLTGMSNKLEIIPIVGMGGIGKTTLARNLYNDPLIVSHFDVRAWTTISLDYNMTAILSSLLCCITGKEVGNKNVDFDTLYKKLYGIRYMIVLDDIWGSEPWDKLRRFFPDNNNGSRIVITTRESDVAKYADSQSVQHQVQLLNRSESWNLLRQIVFGEEDCPHELQLIGSNIARDCGGLPLAINVIGGLLSKLQRSKDVWENIGENVRAAIAKSDDEQFSNVLSLSYNHLPCHLKPCFLYMAAFREDYEIKGSKLIRLWVAEGFVKSNGDQTLEEEAEDYLRALVERNLLLLVIRENKFDGKPLSYSMHDLLRDLCIKKADEEKFLHAKNVLVQPENITISNHRRVISTNAALYGTNKDKYASEKLMSHARSLLGTGYWHMADANLFLSALRLLRVLDVTKIKFLEFPIQVLKLVNLRYLAVSCRSSLPDSGISRLWNLQTLIVRSKWYGMPSDVWEISELRNLKWNHILRLQEERHMKTSKLTVLNKLQTISYVEVTRSVIWRGFFESIPNIQDLSIYYDDITMSAAAVDLSHLQRLETLKCIAGGHHEANRFLSVVRFPCNLRKLTLTRCVVYLAVVAALYALPKLEMLSIWRCNFESEEWELKDGDVFKSLQVLELHNTYLLRWRADETNFPTLRHLLIEGCTKLEDIPIAIGDIPTLELIELEDCSDAVVASAKEILEVQQSEYDNDTLKLRIIN